MNVIKSLLPSLHSAGLAAAGAFVMALEQDGFPAHFGAGGALIVTAVLTAVSNAITKAEAK